jgi:hypothetical protein
MAFSCPFKAVIRYHPVAALMATSNSTKRNNLLLSLSDPKKDNIFTPFA